MSFFNPQGIPEFMLHNYKGDLEDNVDGDEYSDGFEDDLDVLRGYSLVSVTATRDVRIIDTIDRYSISKENITCLDQLAFKKENRN